MEASRTLRVLLVEPDDDRFASVADIARRVPGGGLELSRVASPEEVVEQIEAGALDSVLAPSRLGDDEAAAVATLLQRRGLALPVVALVEGDSDEAGLEALRSEGATEFVEREGLTPQALQEVILRAEARSLVRQALLHDRTLLDTLLDETDLIAVVLDPCGRTLRLNWAAQQVLGLDAQDAVGRPFAELAEEADAEGLADTVQSALHGDGPFYAERPWQTPRGLRRAIAWTISVLGSPASGTSAVLCTALDRTPQRRAGQQIRFQSALLESLTTATQALGLAVDAEGVILVAEGDAFRSGRPDLLGQVVFNALAGHPDVLLLVREALKGQGGTAEVDWEGQTAEAACEPIWWGPQIAGATLTLAVHPEAGDRLDESPLGAVLDCLAQPTALVGVDGGLIHRNAAWAQLVGPEAASVRSFPALFRDPAALTQAFETARAEGRWSGRVELAGSREGTSPRTLNLCASRTARGTWVGLTATLAD